MISVKIKLDGPLQFDLKLDRAIAAREFSEAAPKGAHPHDPPGWVTKRGTRPRRGDNRLANWLGKESNWHISTRASGLDKGKISHAYCNVFLAYAHIIDQGGQVGPVGYMYRAKFTKAGKSKYGGPRRMTWQSGGRTVFAASRRGYTIRGQNYVERGTNRLVNDVKALSITWTKGSPETL